MKKKDVIRAVGLKKTRSFTLFLLLSALLILGFFSLTSLAAGDVTSTAAEKEAAFSSAADLPVFFDGLLSDRGLFLHNEAYVSPLALSRLAGEDPEVIVAFDGAALRFPSLLLTWDVGTEFLRAGGRFLYAPGGCLVQGESLYLPVETLAHLFSVRAELRDDGCYFDTSGLHLIAPGSSDYYETRFTHEDIYWLAQIIEAEGSEEPLAGKIGIGSVILNRVASPDYPPTVIDVVFDREGGIQFVAAAEGYTSRECSEESELAARLCLEGFNTVGDSLYFVNPLLSDPRWFDSSLRYITTVGNHNFYGLP